MSKFAMFGGAQEWISMFPVCTRVIAWVRSPPDSPQLEYTSTEIRPPLFSSTSRLNSMAVRSLIEPGLWVWVK